MKTGKEKIPPLIPDGDKLPGTRLVVPHAWTTQDFLVKVSNGHDTQGYDVSDWPSANVICARAMQSGLRASIFNRAGECLRHFPENTHATV